MKGLFETLIMHSICEYSRKVNLRAHPRNRKFTSLSNQKNWINQEQDQYKQTHFDFTLSAFVSITLHVYTKTHASEQQK